ncbi:hypothetical protein AB0H97_29965 [Streptomyces sp. NPDC050788]|uniref:hypothetical protein n=1 Tax=Streptomyces sp. NPDC050788 TaxID=3155041 RepID=UPI0034151683
MTDYHEAAVTALADLAAVTEQDPEAAMVTAMAQAARRCGLVLDEAPTRRRDFPPKAVVRDLVRRAEPALNAEFQAATATGQH